MTEDNALWLTRAAASHRMAHGVVLKMFKPDIISTKGTLPNLIAVYQQVYAQELKF